MSKIQTHIQTQIQTSQLLKQLLKKYDKIMYLKIFVAGSNSLKNMYYAAVDRHNNNLLNKFITLISTKFMYLCKKNYYLFY
jgi:hypothetical protein